MMEQPAPTFVYFVQAGDGGNVKIGVTNDVGRRIKNLQTASAVVLRVLKVTVGDQAFEAGLHNEFSECRILGEWFRPDPRLLARIGALPSAPENTVPLPVKMRPVKCALHAWRLKAGLTLADVAALIGVSQGFLSDLENGKELPSWATLDALFLASNGAVTPNDFAPFLRLTPQSKMVS